MDVVAGWTPWLSPVIPAYMVWGSMQTELGFNVYMAWIGAAVVEFVGMSAVRTAFQFYDYNSSKTKLDGAAPVRWAVGTAAYYLVVVLVLVVSLDPSKNGWHVLGKALLSSMTIVGAIILALRGDHSRRIMTKEEAKVERQTARLMAKEIRNFPKVSESFGDWRRLPIAVQEQVRDMTVEEIMVKFGTIERTAQNWKKYALDRGNGHHPGGGQKNLTEAKN